MIKISRVQDHNQDKDRQAFVDFLIESGVGGLRDNPQVTAFVQSKADIPLQNLTIDSLAFMEIAIGIEDLYEVSLSPNSISRYESLEDLWSDVTRSPQD